MSIFALFDGLDRAGPGDAESLQWAFTLAGKGPGARVLDAGCGRGADTGTLLELAPEGGVVAVDLAPDFIAHVAATHPRAWAEVADMTAPPGGPFDFIWSAGSAYSVGIEPALTAWRRHLAPGGCAAFSHLCWRVAEPAQGTRDFWASEGAILTSEAQHLELIARAGWRVLAHRWLPQSAWAAYYDPLSERLDLLEMQAGTTDLIASFRAEIALWRQHGEEYGYLLAVVEPS